MVEVNNLTTLSIDEGLIKKVIEKVLEGEKKKGEVSVAFIGPSRMRKINKRYRNKNRATDILSFPESEIKLKGFKIGPLEKSGNLGEIIICSREVKKNAKRYNSDFEKELTKVLIHGTLHLLGYDHERSEKDAKEMKEKQDYCLSIIA